MLIFQAQMSAGQQKTDHFALLFLFAHLLRLDFSIFSLYENKKLSETQYFQQIFHIKSPAVAQRTLHNFAGRY